MRQILYRIKVRLLNFGKIWYKRIKLRQECRRYSGELKIVIGSGGVNVGDGWVLTDLPVLDVTKRHHWRIIFQGQSIYRLLAEHVFEHLTEAQFKIFLNNVQPYLANGARIRIAVPDGFHPSAEYIDYVRPGGTGAGADDHKVLYTYRTMTTIINDNGYNFELLEYFDENGEFHQQAWNKTDGPIMRSADNDQRNKDGKLAYTSLIVDLWTV